MIRIGDAASYYIHDEDHRHLSPIDDILSSGDHPRQRSPRNFPRWGCIGKVGKASENRVTRYFLTGKAYPHLYAGLCFRPSPEQLSTAVGHTCLAKAVILGLILEPVVDPIASSDHTTTSFLSMSNLFGESCRLWVLPKRQLIRGCDQVCRTWKVFRCEQIARHRMRILMNAALTLLYPSSALLSSFFLLKHQHVSISNRCPSRQCSFACHT